MIGDLFTLQQECMNINEGKWFFQGESTEPRAGSGQGRSKRSYETFTELINELYPICLDIGISPGLFYEVL